jgi:hypothetical protein
VTSRGSSVGVVTGCGLDVQSYIPGSIGKIFFLSTGPRPVLGPTQPPIQWVPGVLSPGVKRQRREADWSAPSSAEVRNGGAVLPLPIRLHGIVRN